MAGFTAKGEVESLMISFLGLRNTQAGRDAWVIAGGPSAGFVDPGFFQGKFTVGVNYSWQLFDVCLVVLKEQYALKDALEAGKNVVASRWHCGDKNTYQNQADVDFYVFDHLHNECERVDLFPIGEEESLGLVVSYSTITSAIHLAAWMGARSIILVGHDCGYIDGRIKAEGYPTPDFQIQSPDFYQNFISKIEPQTLAVKDRIHDIYGIPVYSLNPWVNFGLEGHDYAKL